MPEPDIEDLLDRLHHLEDRAAIEETLFAYGTALDYGDRAQFLECFTHDAAYEVSMRVSGTVAMSFHGHEELGAYFDEHTHAPSAWHKHITTNPMVRTDGDTATCISYFIRVDAGTEGGPATVLASGRYRDTFAREGGRWRMQSRCCEVENM